MNLISNLISMHPLLKQAFALVLLVVADFLFPTSLFIPMMISMSCLAVMIPSLVKNYKLLKQIRANGVSGRAESAFPAPAPAPVQQRVVVTHLYYTRSADSSSDPESITETNNHNNLNNNIMSP